MPKKSRRLVGLLEKSRKGVLARQCKRDGSHYLNLLNLSLLNRAQMKSPHLRSEREVHHYPPPAVLQFFHNYDIEEFSSQSSSTSHSSQSAVPSELFTRLRPLDLPGARPEAADSEFLIVRRQELVQLLRQDGAVCKDCMMEYKLVVNNTGIDNEMELECLCPVPTSLSPTTVDVPQEFRRHRKYFLEGNITLVYHSILSNQGYAEFDKLAGMLQRPSIPSIAFHNIAKYIYRHHTDYFNKCNITAHQIVKEHYKKH
ncbi:hypothetical protein Pcinc_002914 [Petrolisthes cinctipes]|uniref:Uncharacterized protein n=1 Tax=Petrolisthes cinctipes TaxID=88211 RepID=A0AAE1L2G7_PETCI|nr:hypothetical protein Pcinc_002914 [Petrolisthes cinctipes]